MDPQTAWDELLAAYRQRDWAEVEQRAGDLLGWLMRGGFPPIPRAIPQLRPITPQSPGRFAVTHSPGR